MTAMEGLEYKPFFVIKYICIFVKNTWLISSFIHNRCQFYYSSAHVGK